MTRTLTGVVMVLGVTLATNAAAQPSSDLDDGIPVTSPVVRQNCGRCHPSDADGRMTRISYQRTTPEGWQQTIRRMVLLDGLEIDPADAREAVRYLANQQGLAPEEAREGAFEVERRLVDYVYTADVETQETCNRCHSFGRVLNQRRTREEWQLLTAMHQGFYPLVDFQSFYRRDANDDGSDDDANDPPAVDKAVEHLSEVFALSTPEWSAWAATMRPPRLAGTWALVGSQQGRGPVYGRVTVTAVSNAVDEFQTQIDYAYARTGESVTRVGNVVVYTGFQWRGRSTTSSGEALREVMFVDRNWRETSGRWFSGNHDEFGLDVTLRRVDTEPVVTGVHPPVVGVTDASVSLSIYGANLPVDLSPSDVDLGPGITVTEVVEASPSLALVRATLASDVTIGSRDVFVGGGFLERGVSVYDQVHRLEVTPDTGMARVGGLAFPKRFEQFEARGYHNGADGEAHTADDLDLGVMEVEWSLEEYAATFGDDDTEFVGELDETGLFTPAVDGPNPARRGNANNVGDVWVVATLSGQNGARTLRARAHLLVTVPLYIRRDVQ